MLLQVSLDIPKLVQELIVHQDLYVLYVIVGFIGPLELLLRLPGVDALQNTKASEVFQGELQLPNGLASSQILGLLATGALFYFLPHSINAKKY